MGDAPPADGAAAATTKSGAAGLWQSDMTMLTVVTAVSTAMVASKALEIGYRKIKRKFTNPKGPDPDVTSDQ